MIPIVVQNGTPLIWNASGNRLLIKFLINTQQLGRLGTVVVFAHVFQGLIPGVNKVKVWLGVFIYNTLLTCSSRQG